MTIETEEGDGTWTAYTENEVEGFCGVGKTETEAVLALLNLLDAARAEAD